MIFVPVFRACGCGRLHAWRVKVPVCLPASLPACVHCCVALFFIHTMRTSYLPTYLPTLLIRTYTYVQGSTARRPVHSSIHPSYTVASVNVVLSSHPWFLSREWCVRVLMAVVLTARQAVVRWKERSHQCSYAYVYGHIRVRVSDRSHCIA